MNNIYPTENEFVVEVKNLSVSYEDSLEPVLSNVNIRVARGEFLAIVGLSGCGKSTLLHAVAGFIPFSGIVNISTKVGMVFQNYAVYPWMSVRENIALGLHNHSVEQKNVICDKMLSKIQLHGHRAKYPTQLSGGQQQRVALARALAPDPDVILLDEPLGALDMFTRYQMHEWLAGLAATERQTFLLVTHNIEEAIFLADRVVIIGEGGLLDELKVDFPRPRKNELKFSEDFRLSVRTVIDLLQNTTGELQ